MKRRKSMNNYKQFNWVTAFILNIVTCGLYSLYLWGYIGTACNNEAVRLGGKKIMSFVVALLLSFVTCGIVGIVWFYLFMNQQVELAKAKGVEVAPTDSPIVLTILMFIPIYSFYVLCDNYNRIIAA